MSSSVICQNFVQNAWKKELCSNCFKSKDEHNLTLKKLKPLPRNDLNCKIIGIMKTQTTIKNNNCKKTRRTVCFPNELIEIIGIGGEDWFIDDDDDDDESLDTNNTQDEEENSDNNEEYKNDENDGELQRITKENTDFNMSSLGDVIEAKKCYNNLLLGKPIVDSDGKKQTLLVTVTPFGEEPKKFNSISKNHKESLTETKTNVVLTSYTSKNDEINEKLEEKSLLEEINETLEQNNKTSIQIISRKRIQNNNNNEKRVNLTRTPALKRDQEKPVIQTLSNNNNNNNNNIKEMEKMKTHSTFSQSREQAGEPDGRADPPETAKELPALPLTPPPTLIVENSPPPSSTNNNVFYEKPQIPSKPNVLVRKPVLTTFQVIPTTTTTTTTTTSQIMENNNKSTILMKQDESDLIRNKRRAPKPPPPPPPPPSSSSSSASSSQSIKSLDNDDNNCEMFRMLQPEPAPRKTLSLSTDNLILNENKKPKNRFSLKKFLRMGTNNNNNNNNTKELTKSALDLRQKHEQQQHEFYLQPQPKPRIIIVHPSELTGAEIITKPTTTTIINNKIDNKPPPPPRNNINDNDLNKLKPIRNPKSNEIIEKQRQLTIQLNENKLINTINNKETVYANIGEVRSSLVPNKPQRTASMREREEKQQQQRNNNNKNITELYDYINSSPEQSPKRLNKRSESSIDVSGDYFKETNLPRTMSLTYCGSETESEIYAPYSFYGSESEVTEDDHDLWPINGRTHKLRARKGRSIVHKNLEDNYGAVVVANHEALAQVLENVQQTNNNHITITQHLRSLKMVENLRWSDFTLNKMNRIFIGKCCFYQAIWQMQHNVTLCVCTGITNSITLQLGNCILTPITEFSDLIPQHFLTTNQHFDDYSQYIQASIFVLPSIQIHTIQSYSDYLNTRNDPDMWRDANFILLQLLNTLKMLQAQGIEELPISLNCFLLYKEMDRDTIYYRLSFLPNFSPELRSNTDEDPPYGSLCMCALKAVQLLHGFTTNKYNHKTLIESLLSNERAVSLTQTKSVLEFSLWGPSDVCLGSTIRERELAIQRWLDLQRATVLHGLVCTRVQLTIYEECHLLFLVRSNARMMSDASLLIESSNNKKNISH